MSKIYSTATHSPVAKFVIDLPTKTCNMKVRLTTSKKFSSDLFMKKIYLMLITMISSLVSLNAFAQPGAMSINQDVSNTYSNTGMTLQGGAFRARFQEDASGTSAGTRNWQFNADGYFNTWGVKSTNGASTVNIASYNSVIVPSAATASGNWEGGPGYNNKGRLLATQANYYYTYNIMKGSSYADQKMSVLETSFNPVTLSSVTQAVGTYGSRTITITTSGTPNASENIFVRYSTNSFTSSTIVQATGSGTTWTATIPWQSSAVTFYVYSSNRSKASIDADVTSLSTQEVHDLSTLNLNNNSGSNYTWTPTTGNVIVASTGGTTSAGYSTLKLAFDAINAGTHTGSITIGISANTSEGATPATLNSTGAGSASYTSVGISPIVDGVSVSGVPASGFGVIQLKGCDNVTIDGDNPNTTGTNRNLSIISTATSTITLTSVIRIATVNVAAALDATSITIKNCVLTGNASGRNASANTSTTGSENNTFGIYVGGNGGSTATDAMTALTSVTTNVIPTSTTVNTLLIDNNSVNSCARGIVFDGNTTASSTGVTITNNLIGDQATTLSGNPPYTTPTTTVYTKGIYIAGTNAITITGNTLKNILSYVATTMTAIELVSAIGSGTINISNNTLNGIVQNSTTTSPVRGILVSVAAGAYTVGSNTVTNVQWVGGSTTATSVVDGIEVNSAGAATIEKNIVSTIYNRNTATFGAYGINLAGGNNHIIRNNFVYDVSHDMSGGAAFDYQYGVFGIRINSGTGHKVYHNTVGMSGTMPGTATSSHLSAAFAITSTSLTGIDVRNNIFSNTLSGGTTSIAHVSVALPSGGTSAMNLTWNNNAYYSGTTAASQGIAQVGTVAGTTFYLASNFNSSSTAGSTNLRNYTSTLLAANTNNDNASYAFTSVAPFNSSTNLHINTGVTPTVLESGGVSTATTGVTTDIDGQTRPGPTAVNGGGTAPDLGADEFDGVPPINNDIQATAFISPVNGGYVATGVAFTPQASFTNNGLLAQTSVTVRYRIIDASLVEVYNQTATIASIASGASTTVSFPSATIAANGTYTIKASAELVGDQATGNDQITGSVTATGQLCGTYHVGSGQTAPFNKLSTAVSLLNAVGASCSVTFLLDDASYGSETYPIAIGNFPGNSSSITLTISPNVGVATVFSGSSATSLIDFSSATYTTINGFNSGGASLLIRNTNSTAPAIRLYNDAHHNLITNCTFETSNTAFTTTTSGAVIFLTSTGTLGNSNNTISYCDFRDRTDVAGTPRILLESYGSASPQNANNTVDHCNFYNFYQDGLSAYGIYLGAGTTDWIISNNSFYQTATRTTTVTGASLTSIYASNSTANNMQITGNYIGGTAALCGGSPLTLTTSTTGVGNVFNGIYLSSVGTTTASSVNGNIVKNISLTTIPVTGASVFPFTGIAGYAGSLDFQNNTVGATSGNGSITVNDNGNALTSTYGFYVDGIDVTPSGTCTVSNNNFGSFTLAGTNTSGTVYHFIRGLLLTGTPTASVNVNNNLFGSNSTTNSIYANMTTTTRPQGILPVLVSLSNTQTVNLTNNTFKNITNTTTGTTNTAVMPIDFVGTAVANISGNTISEITSSSLLTTSTPGSNAVSGIYFASTTTSGHIISGNTLQGLRSTATSAATAVYGIAINASSVSGSVTKNKISDLTNTSSSTTSKMYGMTNYNGATWNFSNNFVSITNGANTTSTDIQGFHEEAGSSTNANYYYNSAYIGGTATGATNSYAFNRSLSTTVVVKNNIFQNARSGGTGLHYAIGNTASTPSTGWSATASDYNDLYSGITANLGEWGAGTPRTFGTWKSSSGGDANSLNVSPVFTSITDLHLVTDANCSLDGSGNNTGIALATDIDGDSRGGVATDIGADEFTSTFPTISAGSNQSVCSNATATLAGTNLTGSTGTWTVVAGTGTFSPNANTYNATVSGLTVGTNTFKWTVTKGSCSGNANVNITANSISTLSTVGTSTACSGSGATINLTGLVAGSTSDVSYNINGGATQTATGVVADGSGNGSFTSVAVTDANDGQSLTITSMTRTDVTPNCGPTTFNSSVTLSVGNIWVGSTSDGNSGSNWTCGLPSGTTNIIIPTTPAGGSMPVLSGNLAVGKVTLQSSATLGIGGNILTVNGGVSGAGTISGSSTSELVIGGNAGTLNFTTGSGSLKNLTLNSAASATLGTALDVYGTITLTSATLNLNAKNLTLKSDATNTARIADLTGSTLSGATNVTMERFIPLRTTGGVGTGNTGRAYRLLAPTVTTSGTINANWQEGQTNTAIGTNINNVPNYGTQITGTGGAANGFDKTQSNAASLYLSSNAQPNSQTYTAISNTTSTSLNALTGYFLWVRGDRSMDMTIPNAPGTMPTSSTTLRTTGTLVTGNVSAFTNAYTGGAGTLNLVTNPYPSPIDWSAVNAASSNITQYYTLWDPEVSTRGGFVTVKTDGTKSDGTSAATTAIQSGQAFFVEASGASAPVVNIQESQKIAGNNNGVFRITTGAPESFSTALYVTEANGYHRVYDAVNSIYDNSFNANVDAGDAREISNWDENIAINRSGSHLSIEARPVILTRDTIPLFMSNMKQQSYDFVFTPSSFTNTALKAELIDKFLGTRTLLSVTAPTTVNFTVTADAASKASDRFMVVFGPQSALPIDVITINAYQKDQSRGQVGVQVEWTSKTETNMDRYEVERSFDGTQFAKLSSVAAIGNSNVVVNYSWYDNNPQTGINYYRIRAFDRAGQTKYTAIVKVAIGKGTPAIVIYPNPVQGSDLSLQLVNLEKGIYNVSLSNNMGQVIMKTDIQHNGGTAVKTISLPALLTKGNYQLTLRNGNNVNLTSQVIKN